MKKYIHINDLFKNINKRGSKIWTDKLGYIHIFFIWAIVIFSFGFLYHFYQNDTSYLFYNSKGINVDNLQDSIYFSFIAATTTGFGDIIPYGLFKIISIFEVVFGLMLLAIVTSKLVSIKQDVILSELYELSFNEKINKLRSSFLLFRQNLDRVIINIEERVIRRKEINNLYTYLSSLEDTLHETFILMIKPSERSFIKKIDPVNTELIINSILNSFEKIYELLVIINSKKLQWKTDVFNDLINKCIMINESLFNKLNSSKNVMKESIEDFNIRKNDIMNRMKEQLSK